MSPEMNRGRHGRPHSGRSGTRRGVGVAAARGRSGILARRQRWWPPSLAAAASSGGSALALALALAALLADSAVATPTVHLRGKRRTRRNRSDRSAGFVPNPGRTAVSTHRSASPATHGRTRALDGAEGSCVRARQRAAAALAVATAGRRRGAATAAGGLAAAGKKEEWCFQKDRAALPRRWASTAAAMATGLGTGKAEPPACQVATRAATAAASVAGTAAAAEGAAVATTPVPRSRQKSEGGSRRCRRTPTWLREQGALNVAVSPTARQTTPHDGTSTSLEGFCFLQPLLSSSTKLLLIKAKNKASLRPRVEKWQIGCSSRIVSGVCK